MTTRTSTITTQSIAMYRTATGQVGIEVTKRVIGTNPPIYSYTGKWGAGSARLEGVVQSVRAAIARRRGLVVQYETDEWARAMNAGRSAGRLTIEPPKRNAHGNLVVEPIALQPIAIDARGRIVVLPALRVKGGDFERAAANAFVYGRKAGLYPAEGARVLLVDESASEGRHSDEPGSPEKPYWYGLYFVRIEAGKVRVQPLERGMWNVRDGKRTLLDLTRHTIAGGNVAGRTGVASRMSGRSGGRRDEINGFTFEEWLRAAGTPPSPKLAPILMQLMAAWESGADPVRYAADAPKRKAEKKSAETRRTIGLSQMRPLRREHGRFEDPVGLDVVMIYQKRELIGRVVDVRRSQDGSEWLAVVSPNGEPWLVEPSPQEVRVIVKP